MTFKEAYERVVEVATERKDSICLEVEAWHHRQFYEGEPPNTSLTYKLYSCNEKRSYRGPTIDQVIDAYASDVGFGEGKADAEALEAVGSP